MLEDLSRQDYNDRIAKFREQEYPMLGSSTYLDHAGTTLYSRSLVDAVSSQMLDNLMVNPHSASFASQSTTQSIDDLRVRVLRYFEADPSYFDLIFVANATAAIKLVAETFRDHPHGFWYGYHKDAHTSLVGVRELSSRGNHCFRSDIAVEEWLGGSSTVDVPSMSPVLFAYPGQSNMDGRRLPLDWSSRLRASTTDSYVLLDAAALVATSSLDLSEHELAPDFIALSFYKIFGYPDLGALIVHKRAGNIFQHRRYFGGGTVEVVSSLNEQWHISKATSLHERVEDGTLPIRSILALRCSLQVHAQLYGGPSLVAKHTAYLADTLHDRMAALRHHNGLPVCILYQTRETANVNLSIRGPIIAFNLQSDRGEYYSCYELNKLASVQNIHLRTGTLCNPGGVAHALGLRSQDLQDSFDNGFRCGTSGDVRNGNPIAMARASFGACSTIQDIETFLRFVEYYFVQTDPIISHHGRAGVPKPKYIIKAITVYPIKSCAGWSIPTDQRWNIGEQGLRWDREWCLVHQGTRTALSQKRCPAMALMRPSFDFTAQTMCVLFAGEIRSDVPSTLVLPLDGSSYSAKPRLTTYDPNGDLERRGIRLINIPAITKFFSTHLGIPCFLARALTHSESQSSDARSQMSKSRSEDDQHHRGHEVPHLPGSFPTPPASPPGSPPTQRTLANESPILAISQTSLDHLNKFGACQQTSANEIIEHNINKAIPPESFRANIFLGASSNLDAVEPFEEENWIKMRFLRSDSRQSALNNGGTSSADVPSAELTVIGSCQRCQMICIDQQSGERYPGPFSILTKLRRNQGGARFGIHCCISNSAAPSPTEIGVGDLVEGVPGP